jgi:hypothetical protein
MLDQLAMLLAFLTLGLPAIGFLLHIVSANFTLARLQCLPDFTPELDVEQTVFHACADRSDMVSRLEALLKVT